MSSYSNLLCICIRVVYSTVISINFHHFLQYDCTGQVFVYNKMLHPCGYWSLWFTKYQGRTSFVCDWFPLRLLLSNVSSACPVRWFNNLTSMNTSSSPLPFPTDVLFAVQEAIFVWFKIRRQSPNVPIAGHQDFFSPVLGESRSS